MACGSADGSPRVPFSAVAFLSDVTVSEVSNAVSRSRPGASPIRPMSSLLHSAATAGLAAIFTIPAAQASAAEPTQATPVKETSAGREGESEGNPPDAFGDIVVTARKRAETVQTIPVAVSAFDSARLEERGFSSLQNISFSTPNVALDVAGTTRTSAIFSIRGLGANSSVQSIEPSVGTFIDGAYLAVNSGVVTDTFDVDRIEVLRGPQGTLFGRNVTGGAVLINTKRPSDTLGAELLMRATTGLSSSAQPDYVAAGAITGPVSNGVAVRLAGYFHKENGYGRNLAIGLNPTLNGGDTSQPDAKTWFIRPSILIRPSSDLLILARYEHLESKGSGMPQQNWGNIKPDTFHFSNNEPGLTNTNVDNVNVEFNLEVGPGTITNIAHYRDLRETYIQDADGTRFTLFHSSGFVHSRQISNELRYSGALGIVNFTVGAYAFQADLDTTEARLFGATVQSGGGTQKTTSFAAFTENDFELTDKLSAIVGLRYTREKKKAAVAQISSAQKCGALFPATDSNCLIDARSSKSWSLFGWRFGLKYQLSDEVLTYATASRAFRSGGYSLRQSLPVAPLPFDEEKVDAFEVGIKATYLGGRARTNLALYTNKVRGLQRAVSVVIPVPPFSIQTPANAADARFRGFELEQNLRPIDEFSISAYVGYIDAKTVKALFDLNNDGTINAADIRPKPVRAPEWTFGTQAILTLPLGEHTLKSSVSYDYRATNFFTEDNRGQIPSVNLVNARATLELENGISLAIFGNNLLNEVVYGVVAPTGALLDTSGAFPLRVTPRFGPTPQSSISQIVQPPRTFGLELRYNF